MAKKVKFDTSFNFGANKKARTKAGGKSKNAAGSRGGTGRESSGGGSGGGGRFGS